MRFITTHTQPSAVKRELKLLRQDLVCASSQHQQTLVERTAQLPRDDGIVCGELRRLFFHLYIQHAVTHMLANADRNVARRVSLANSMMHALRKKTCDDSKHDII